jgi:hypothetical protein
LGFFFDIVRRPGWGYPNDRLNLKPILKRMGFFVLGGMNDIAICDVKHKV